MNIQHLLVPVDFSEGTAAAVSCAVEFAGKFNARITLLHVLQTIFPPASELGFTFAEQEKIRQDNAAEELRKLAATVAPIPAATVMESGTPWDRIVHWAGAHAADLIIMPTHGRSGLKHLWIGSVAERVVQHAPCAVLVVRGTPPESTTS